MDNSKVVKGGSQPQKTLGLRMKKSANSIANSTTSASMMVLEEEAPQPPSSVVSAAEIPKSSSAGSEDAPLVEPTTTTEDRLMMGDERQEKLQESPPSLPSDDPEDKFSGPDGFKNHMAALDSGEIASITNTPYLAADEMAVMEFDSGGSSSSKESNGGYVFDFGETPLTVTSSETVVAFVPVDKSQQNQEEMEFLTYLEQLEESKAEESKRVKLELFSQVEDAFDENKSKEWPASDVYISSFGIPTKYGHENPNIVFKSAEGNIFAPALYHLTEDPRCSAGTLENFVKGAVGLDHNAYSSHRGKEPHTTLFKSPLHAAVSSRQIDKVKTLCKLKRLDKNLGVWNLNKRVFISPLATAINEGAWDVASFLLSQKDLDPNLGCSEGSHNHTPLKLALEKFRDNKDNEKGKAVKKFILELMADRQVSSSFLRTWGAKLTQNDDDIIENLLINSSGHYDNI